jgi:hypothetical protein
MTKKIVPVLRPSVVLERPINQTGGTARFDVIEASQGNELS